MANPQVDENSWTTFEKLLLMQSVYKHGDNWLAISRTLKQHPMVSHTPDFFTVKNCQNKYNSLVDPLKNEAEIEDEHKKRSGEYVNDKQRMPWTAKLARQLYHERIVELKSFISSTEKRFRDLVNEIDDIKSGKSDSKFVEMIKKRELEKSSTTEVSKESTDTISDVNVKIEPSIILPSKVDSVIPMDVDTTSAIIEKEIVAEPQIEIKPMNIEMDPSSTTGVIENDVDPSPLISVEVNKDIPQTPATPLAEPNENLIIDPLKEQNVQTATNVATNMEILRDNVELPAEEVDKMMDIDDEISTEKPIIESSVPALESTSETDVSKTEQAKKMVVSPNTDSITAEDTPQTIGGDVAMDLCEHSVEFLPEVTGESPERINFTENIVSSPSSMEEVDRQETIVSQEKYEPEGQPSKITVKEETENKEVVKGKGKELEISEITSKQSIVPTKEETAQETDIINSAESLLTEPAAETKTSKDDISEEIKDDAGDVIMADLPTLPEESGEDKHDSKEKAISTPQPEFKEPITPGVSLVPITPVAAVAATPSNVPPSTPGDLVPPTPTHQYDTAPTPSGETPDDKKLKTWQKLVNMILHEINNHRFASVFQNPIREQDAPGYYDIVKQPMDLKSLKKRLREGTIHDTNSFHRDLMLMFMNASVFNREETDIHQMALEMKDHVETQILDFRRSEGSGGTHEPATRRKSMAIDANEAVYFTSDRRSENDRPTVASSSLRGKFKDDTADHRPIKKPKRLSVSLKKSERDI